MLVGVGCLHLSHSSQCLLGSVNSGIQQLAMGSVCKSPFLKPIKTELIISYLVSARVITLGKIVLDSKHKVQVGSQLETTLNSALIGASVLGTCTYLYKLLWLFFFPGWHCCVGKVDLFSSVFCFATLEIQKSLPKQKES